MRPAPLPLDANAPPATGYGSSRSRSNKENLLLGPDVSPPGKQRTRSVSGASSSSSAPAFTNDSTTSITSAPLQTTTTRARSPLPPLPHEDTLRINTMDSEYVLAMHDYEPQQSSTTCLSFRTGQVIHVFNRDPSGWWDGELEGKRGWFPSNYVNADFGKSNMVVAQAAVVSDQPLVVLFVALTL
jgi:son of sevenless-like protein